MADRSRLPYGDIDDAVKEIQSVAKMGIKGLELSCSWDAARLLQSNNVGCRLLYDTEAIKLQLPNNRRLSCAGSPCQDESLHAFPIIAVAVDAVPSPS
jgi:hypothetical protein